MASKNPDMSKRCNSFTSAILKYRLEKSSKYEHKQLFLCVSVNHHDSSGDLWRGRGPRFTSNSKMLHSNSRITRTASLISADREHLNAVWVQEDNLEQSSLTLLQQNFFHPWAPITYSQCYLWVLCFIFANICLAFPPQVSRYYPDALNCAQTLQMFVCLSVCLFLQVWLFSEGLFSLACVKVVFMEQFC